MAGSPQHATLVPDEVETLTFDQDFARIEVLNVDGAGAVYFRIGEADPEIGGIGSHVLPAAICSVELDVPTSGLTEVRLISGDAVKVSVRGVLDLGGRP